MVDAHAVGSAQVLLKLGLSNQATALPIDLKRIQELTEPTLLSRLESLITPDLTGDSSETYRKAKRVAQEELTSLKKRFGLSPVWFGSMPMGTNLPNDVDIDLFTPIANKDKFQKVITELKNDPDYYYSAVNTPDTGFQVFKRKAKDKDDYPVDIALALGPQAVAHGKKLSVGIAATRNLPESVRLDIIKKKHLLKKSPMSFGDRYYSWKKELAKATNTYTARTDLEKVSTIVDLSQNKQLDKFRRFIKYKDMYGHRTHNLDSVLEAKGLMSALEALKRGKLRSFEAGSSVGTHKKVQYNDLSQAQLSRIEKDMLVSSPDDSVFEGIANATDRTEDAVKADFIRQDFNKIKRFLKKQENPEEFRKDYFSISKLGPNIFVTKGGIVDAEEYGDSAILARSHTAKKSPFMNLVTNEFIIPAKDTLEPRKLRIGSGYVLAPKIKIKALNSDYPHVKFVATEDIPEDIKDTLYKPTHSLKEIWQRWIPSALSGDLSIRQTH